MEKECVIIKAKEYQELLQKAEGNKPEYIEIIIWSDPYHVYGATSSLFLSSKLSTQLYHIKKLIKNCIDKKAKELANKEANKILAENYLKFNLLPWYKKLHYRFEFK